MTLTEFVPGQIWIKDYPIRYAGCRFDARMTVLKISDTQLMLHSPSEIDPATKQAISALGDVACIVAPGPYRYFHVGPAQEYQVGWNDRLAARRSLEAFLAWDFEAIVMAHGDLITDGARETAVRAWRAILNGA